MEIIPPFGYKEVVPLLRDHRVKMLEASVFPDFILERNAIPITMSEIPMACHDYPIIFSPYPDGKGFAILAVLGLKDGENLFAKPDQWLPGTYVPAYLRRFPFCMTRVTVEGVEQAQRIVCVEKHRITEDGTPLFDDEGKPVPRWLEIEAFLNEYEADSQRTIELCSLLNDFKLLEAFEMRGTMGTEEISLGGMYRVDAARLEFMTTNELKTLVKKGAMWALYMHLSSLNRFQKLIEMRQFRDDIAAADAVVAANPDLVPQP